MSFTDDYPGSHRRRIAVRVGRYALFALLLFTAGLAVGRSTAPDTAAPDGADSAPTPTGSPSEDAGARFARSEAGAVAAAADYLAMVNSQATLDPAYGEQVFREVALPDAVEELVRQQRERNVSAYDDPMALANDPAFVLIPLPIGYRVDRYTDAEATVTIWETGVGVGPGELAVIPDLRISEVWGTATLTLRWVDGGWKLAAVAHGTGPTRPDKAAQMRDFTPFWPREVES